MPKLINWVVLLNCFLLPFCGFGQIIHGEVYDATTKEPIRDVAIENIYTTLDVASGENGGFIIAAANGQLLEFKKRGYNTARARIPMGYVPAYFKIGMTKGYKMDTSRNRDTRYSYASDSERFYALYKHELDFPKMSGIDMIASPFSAMSKKNKEIWQFQDDYSYFEKEKYVDRTFNASLINKFTGLTGDSLQHYMKRFRPSYEQLHAMNDYSYFTFIKQTVHMYRNPVIPRNAQ